MPPESFIGKRVQEVLPRDVAAAFAKAVQQVLREERLATMGYDLSVPAGSKRFEAGVIPFRGRRRRRLRRENPLLEGGMKAMELLQVSQSVMDENPARILLGTFERVSSALDLSRRFAFPIAACYRRITELEGMGLVYCERELPSRNGKDLQLFRSRLKSVRIALEDGRLRARVEIGPAGVLSAPEGQVTEQILNLHEVVPRP